MSSECLWTYIVYHAIEQFFLSFIGDACDSNPCENGGLCVSGLDGFYTCECPDGITDSNCSNVMEVGKCK